MRSWRGSSITSRPTPPERSVNRQPAVIPSGARDLLFVAPRFAPPNANSLIEFRRHPEVHVSESQKTYSNGEITVIWKPGVCIHSGKCVQGLSEVFNVSARPWINIDGASTDRIIKQVEQCPSGALSYVRNEKIANAAR